MRKIITSVLITGMILLVVKTVSAQNIIISPELEKNAQPMKVKIGTAGFGKCSQKYGVEIGSGIRGI